MPDEYQVRAGTTSRAKSDTRGPGSARSCARARHRPRVPESDSISSPYGSAGAVESAVSRVTALLGSAALAAQALAGVVRAEPASDCVAWPGEFDPLPTISDHDYLRAQWARMRGAELVRVAARLETEDPVESQQMWRHALCLDPANPALARDAERAAVALTARTTPPTVHTAVEEVRPKPPSVDAPPPPSDPCRSGAEACPRLREVDRSLARIDALLQSAHFEEVVSLQRRPRAILDGLPSSPVTRARRLRLETATATADVAFGRRDDAKACFSRALAADPKLRLDPAATSPKVLRVLDEARDKQTARNAP